MMVETHPLILSLRSAGLKDLDPSNMDEVHNMWHAFSKAKNSIDGGDRLEYLSWRLYSREIMRQQANPRPKCADITSSFHESTPGDSESDLSASAEDDWESAEDESDLDDEPVLQSTNDLLARRASNRRKSSLSSNGSSGRPRLSQHRRSQGTLLDRSRSKLHRPLSSVELQHLFIDVHENTVPTASQEDCKRKKNKASDGGSKIPVESSGSRKEEQLHMTRPRNSSAVRGFSPSSVSVTKLHNPPKPAVNTSQKDYLPHESLEDYKLQRPPARKMFFLGGMDSDAESSTAGSFEKGDGKSNLENTLDSEWDDMSDADEVQAEKEEIEARRKEMFKERPVPTKPLLKRSLLSSLFVPSMTNRGEKSRSEETDISKEEANRKAPINILLDAPLAPHVPFVDSSHQKSSSPEDLDVNMLKPYDRGILSRPQYSRAAESLDNSLISSTNGVSPHTGDSFTPSAMHITARPEIYRASTDMGRHRSASNDGKAPDSWAHQHEDIYDPLNYHSRGW